MSGDPNIGPGTRRDARERWIDPLAAAHGNLDAGEALLGVVLGPKPPLGGLPPIRSPIPDSVSFATVGCVRSHAPHAEIVRRPSNKSAELSEVFLDNTEAAEDHRPLMNSESIDIPAGESRAIEWIDELVNAVPALTFDYQNHLQFNGEVLTHVLFGDFTRWAVTEFATNPGSLSLRRFLHLLELGVESGDAYINDLVGVSFVENIGFGQQLLHFLPPRMTETAKLMFPPEFRLFQLDLTDEERFTLREGLMTWGGPTHLTDRVAKFLGFDGEWDLYEGTGFALLDSLSLGEPLCAFDWLRVIGATEFVFASYHYGAFTDWEPVTGLTEEVTLQHFRAIWSKVHEAPELRATMLHLRTVEESEQSRMLRFPPETDVELLARDYWVVDRALWGPGDRFTAERRRDRLRAQRGDLRETNALVRLALGNSSFRERMIVALAKERSPQDDWTSDSSRAKFAVAKAIRDAKDHELVARLRNHALSRADFASIESWL